MISRAEDYSYTTMLFNSTEYMSGSDSTSTSSCILCEKGYSRKRQYETASSIKFMIGKDVSRYITQVAESTINSLGEKIWQWKNDSTSTSDDNYYYTWNKGTSVRRPPIDPRQRLRDIMRSRLAPRLVSRRKSMPSPKDIREQRARDTLRRVIGDDKFRRFLLKGFITVQGKSGLVYQIFPGHGITNVFDQGKKIERLCVVLSGNFPPTDSVIMRYLMILNNEEEFRSKAFPHNTYGSHYVTVNPKAPDPEPLQLVFARLKRQASKAA